MTEQINEDTRINKIALALSQAQGEFLPIHKNKVNPYFNSKYADLDCILEATKPALTKYKIAHVFTMGDGVMTLSLIHESGQSLTSSLKFNENQKAQAMGGDMTYYRRYLFSAMVNVAADDDDDGNNANKSDPNKKGTYTIEDFDKKKSDMANYIESKGDAGYKIVLDAIKKEYILPAEMEERIKAL